MNLRGAVATNAATHEIQIDEEEDFSDPFLGTSQDTVYTAETPLPNEQYYWRVRAVNIYETQSAWSTVRVLHVDVPPVAPVLTSPADGTTVAINVPVFTWESASGAATYQLLVDNEPDFASPVLDVVVSSTTYTSTSALANGQYYWRVRARNLYGTEGVWSTSHTLTVDVLPAAPVLSAPGDGSTATTDVPTFTWSSVAEAARYQIQVDDANDFTSPAVDVNVSSTTYTPTSPLAEEQYYWRVRALNNLDTPGAWSSMWAVPVDVSTTPLTVFVENFNDGNVTENPVWVPSTGAYAIIDGELHADGAIIDGSDRYLAPFGTTVTLPASDYLELAFRGKLKSAGNPQVGRGIQLVTGENASGNGYALNITNGYVNGFPTNKHSISLTVGGPTVSGELVDLIVTSFTPAYDQVYAVKAVRSGGNWSLYVDGVLIGSAAELVPMSVVNGISLYTVGSAMVDDIYVGSIPSSPSPLTVFSDNYNDGDVTQNPAWNTLGTTFAVTNGELHSDGGDIDASDRYIEVYSSAVNMPASDYLEISYRGKLNSVGNPQVGRGIQVVAGENSTGINYSLNITNGYINGFGTNKHSISLTMGDPAMPGEVMDVIVSSFTPAYDQVYAVKAVRSGGAWSLYADGALIGSAAQPQPMPQVDFIKIYTVGSVMIDDTYIGTIPSQTIMFSENFNDGNMTANPVWGTPLGVFSIVSGELHSDGGDIDASDRYISAYSSLITMPANDYLEISYRGKLKSVGNPQVGRGIQVVAGENSTGINYSLNITNGYINGFGTNKHSVSLTVGDPTMAGEVADVIVSSFTPAYDQVYIVKAVRSGGMWSLYVDGALIGSVAEPRPLTVVDVIPMYTVGSVMVDDIYIGTVPSSP